MVKKIKNSKRGLTFAIENEKFPIGSHFIYTIDTKRKKIIISNSETGNTVSRKRSKPLFDIRSKEVKKLISAADTLEVESLENEIIVHVLKKAKVSCFKKKNVVKNIADIRISREYLKASGTNECYQYTLDDWFSSYATGNNKTSSNAEILQGINDTYKVISLFSGAGLLDYGFVKNGGYEIIYANDFDSDACKTYQDNIGNHIECKDIREVDTSKLPKADVIISGPCCQGFSQSNRRNKASEEAEMKRTLILEHTRITKAINPKVFVVENVPRFLTEKDGYYLNILLGEMSDYDISVQKVKDCDLGGYTKRERAIIIGSKIGKIDMPKMKVLPQKVVKDALSKVDSSWFNYDEVTKSSKETQENMSYVPQSGNWKYIPRFQGNTKKHSDVYFRLDPEQVAPTIVNWRKITMMPPVGNRILSTSEAAALTGLDKNFRFTGGGIASHQQQIGNGVPFSISNTVANVVKKALDAFYNNSKILALAR